MAVAKIARVYDILYFVVFVCLFLTAQFTVQPVSVERAEGLKAVFRCQYQAEGLTVTYDWLLNNSGIMADTETVTNRPPSSPGEPTTLIIMATPQHNNSNVQCLAIISNGMFKISDMVTLTVHGELVNYDYVHKVL